MKKRMKRRHTKCENFKDNNNKTEEKKKKKKTVQPKKQKQMSE